MSKWYPLDNAAQIFPSLIKKRQTNSFRLSALLKDNVDKEILKQALAKTLERFPTFKVCLKKGIFWFYLNENIYKPTVKKEDAYFCESQNFRRQNFYLFNVQYFGRRLSVEIFHALTDGNGGIEFLKALLYNYLLLKGYTINDEGLILTNSFEQLLDESQDSFAYNYEKKIKKKSQESKAFKITGKFHAHEWTSVIQAIIELDALKRAAHKYNATITEYISAVILYNVSKTYYYNHKNKKSNLKHPIRLFVPINVRKYFNSTTLRNFVLFLRTTSRFREDVTFEEVLKHIKDTFIEENNEQAMLARIKTNMMLEKNVFVRFMPLFLKSIIIKIVFHFIGTGSNTISFSNIGKVNLPKDMIPHIERFDFANGGSKYAPINVGAIGYENKFTLTFTSRIIERKLQKAIIEHLIKDEVSLVCETNDLEV